MIRMNILRNIPNKKLGTFKYTYYIHIHYQYMNLSLSIHHDVGDGVWDIDIDVIERMSYNDASI